MSFLLRASFALSIFVSPVASAQSLQSFIAAANGFNAQVQVPGNPLKVVGGVPFSAEETRQLPVLGPDGSASTVPDAPRRLYRDLLGRTRIEHEVTAGGASRTLAEINDPGAGVYYLLDLQGRIAHRVKYTPPRVRVPNPIQPKQLPTVTGALITPGGPAGTPLPATETLGTREIQGVRAEGKRSTITVPVNPARTTETFSRVTETWYSPELEITLLTTVTDPRSGDSRIEVVNLRREEPPRDLFEVPPGFEVVDQPPVFVAEFRQR